MPHEVSLIAALAFGFGLALIFGFVAEKLKAPALLGYLLAGFLIGPVTPGFVADPVLTNQLAEVGVMLLMFGVGMHFSLDDLLSVKRIAIPGAIVQMGTATLIGMAFANWWGWPMGQGLVFGLALSVASTVVLLKALEAQGQMQSPQGRIAIGWLVVEDLAMVLVLVLLPPLVPVLTGAETQLGWGVLADLGLTLVKVGVFIALMLVGGKKLIPYLLWQVAKTGSRELFTLSTISLAISLAYVASSMFGVSFALGAFFAGMVMRESEFSHRAAHESLPLRDAFAVLFFVSVGMLFDPSVVWDYPGRVLAVVGIIVLGKSLAAGLLVLAFRYPLQQALTISASLAQIGEFSFILVGLGMYLGVATPEVQSLVVVGAIVSIALNPLLFAAIPGFRDRLLHHSALARRLDNRAHSAESLPAETTTDARHNHLIVLNPPHGLSPLWMSRLQQLPMPLLIVDSRRDTVRELRQQGLVAVAGDASDPATLVQAHVMNAKALLIAEPDVSQLTPVCTQAKMLNPNLEILVMVPTEEERQRMADLPVDHWLVAETLALQGVEHTLTKHA